MKIGVLKERKVDENRVALVPEQIEFLCGDGKHVVLVESGAGENAKFSDREYAAHAVPRLSVVMRFIETARSFFKVKAPVEDEYDRLNSQHTLFTYLHFDENIPPEKINRLVARGLTGIAYEWVESDGRFPLLEPMSHLTGYLFAQRATELCTRYKGKFCGRYEAWMSEPAHMLIIGLGRIGMSALQFALANRYRVTVVDKHPETLNTRMNHRFRTVGVDYMTDNQISAIQFGPDFKSSQRDLVKVLPSIDMILNCAVRRSDLPKSKLAYILTRDMLKSLAAGSVVCDTSACDKDLIETCVSSESLTEVYKVDDVVYYNCDHLPSYVGRSASQMLTAATFPFVKMLADLGTREALKASKPLRKGVSCFEGPDDIKASG